MRRYMKEKQIPNYNENSCIFPQNGTKMYNFHKKSLFMTSVLHETTCFCPLTPVIHLYENLFLCIKNVCRLQLLLPVVWKYAKPQQDIIRFVDKVQFQSNGFLSWKIKIKMNLILRITSIELRFMFYLLLFAKYFR